jgi:hypothetical protein
MSSIKRKRSKSNKKLEKSNRGDNIIRLPIDKTTYEELSLDTVKFRAKLSELISVHPEIFPTEISLGYEFHDKRTSKKQAFTHRRIRLRDGRIYGLYSHSWLPYMSADTSSSWYPLLLMYYGIPTWLIVLGFQKDEMHWYRKFKHFGRFNLVGSTIKNPEKIPQDVAVDEKFTWLRGTQIYVAMVGGLNCLLGICLSQHSDEESLKEAYGVFKEEALLLSPNYQLLSFVSDGWSATSNAMKCLFKQAIWTLCFLHSVIKIRSIAAKEPQKQVLFDKVWQVYQQENATDFIIKMEELKQWSDTNIEKKTVLEQINKMYSKTSLFTQSYHRENALRTSNMIDRPMKVMDRFLFCHQYFHGHLASAQWMVRAFAIVYNFVPFAPRTRRDNPNYFTSRMANINGFQYQENWLDNLMVAASCNGKLTPHQIS